MAETFLFNLAETVLSKVSSLIVEEITSAWKVKRELNKLHNTLSTIKAVLLDADEQQAKNHEVRDWLEKLKDVVYDVDDLLDEFLTQILRRKLQSQGRILKRVRGFISCLNPIAYRFKIAYRIKDIRSRLDEIAADRKNFHFREHVYVTQVKDKEREQTHSYVTASDIIGRDNDRKSITDLLLSANSQQDVSVIPIVGLGGLGKTTLVKLVYNDERVTKSFRLRLWVSVSEDFRLSKIIEKILRSATGENFGHLDMDQLQSNLRNVLNGKRYLLVLDDVWNEDHNKWMELRDLLNNCSAGSKVVVTTRSKKVAKMTGTVPLYELGGLSDDDCLSLFLKCAFRGQENYHPNLVEIGKQIVKKCGGVPLAVKTLGGLLYMKPDEQEWLRIRDDEIWEIEQEQSDILPILRLSYEQMPSHLKQCFAYCSMLPKDYEVPREMFINLWIAQGLIPLTNGSRQLDNVGNHYFNELLSRFCFQDVVEAFDGEILACRIHNLVHDLAQSVAGTECLNVKANPRTISERVCHLCYNPEDSLVKNFPEALLKFKKLRSFNFSMKLGSVYKAFAETITLNFRCLRVLILRSLELEELQNSIGNLKQLRFLNLSNSGNIKFLPKSICKLLNLQTLDLINCEQLQELPGNIGKMMSLRTLYLTSRQVTFQKRGCQSFNSLQFLLLYKCDCLKLPSEGFEQLTGLRVLRIYECPRLVSIGSCIKYLVALEKLWIWDCEELDLQEGEGMEGLCSLQSLLLMGLPKLITLPEGLKQTAPATLKYLRIANCPNLIKLPNWLQTFASLQRLYIEDCPNLQHLPEGEYRHNAKVHISDCPQLKGGC